MNKKFFTYFISSVILIGSASAYFISKEIPEDEVVITGEYDIWVSENYESETQSLTVPIAENSVTQLVPETTVVTMPTVEETMTQAVTEQFLMLNINIASKEELMMLDDIGEVTAQKIIEYRISYGGFKNIEEILNVNGIGEKTFFNIRNHIYVENPVYPIDLTEESDIISEESVYEESPTEVLFDDSSKISDDEYTQPSVSQNPIENPTEVFNKKFDLNKVTIYELETVPGLDMETAVLIIELRTSIKYFSHPYELLYVDGMTEERLCDIIDYFYVSNNNN